MSILKRASFWVTLFMLLIILGFVIMSLGYNARARLFPLIIGIPGIIAGVLILASEKWPNLIRRFDVNVGMDVKVIKDSVEAEAEVEGAPELSGGEQMRRVLACAGWMAGYAITVLLVGFNPANFAMPVLYSKIHTRTSWLKAIIIGMVTALFIYFMFDFFMKVGLFPGILFGGYLPAL